MSKTFSTERICAFTDGVYAIVITLLVLELKAPEVPGLTNEQVFADLVKQSRVFLAYFISFFVVGWLWFRHHGIFKALEKSDNVVIFINFIHLLFVSLIPYTASVAGRYANDQLAVLMFFGNIGLSGLTVSLLKQYVLPKKEWQNKELFDQLLREDWVHRYTIPVVAMLAILVSFFDHQIALWVFLVLTPLLALITWR
jgi:uncharacterized membrane protein